MVCEGFLRESALTAECSNPQPQTPTEFGATIPRLDLNNFGSIGVCTALPATPYLVVG